MFFNEKDLTTSPVFIILCDDVHKSIAIKHFSEIFREEIELYLPGKRRNIFIIGNSIEEAIKTSRIEIRYIDYICFYYPRNLTHSIDFFERTHKFCLDMKRIYNLDFFANHDFEDASQDGLFYFVVHCEIYDHENCKSPFCDYISKRVNRFNKK